MSDVRLDKYLWAMRIYKTRSDAAEATKQNRVMLNNAYAKASREVKAGDVITVKKAPVTYTFRVKETIGARQGAKLVPQYIDNITPPEELEKLNAPREMVFVTRDRGTGRPTKRDRREIDSLMSELGYDDSREE